MEDRDFTEIDLRRMLHDASAFRHDVVPERFVVETNLAGVAWEVIVEPDSAAQLLVVVTAYRVE